MVSAEVETEGYSCEGRAGMSDGSYVRDVEGGWKVMVRECSYVPAEGVGLSCDPCLID